MKKAYIALFIFLSFFQLTCLKQEIRVSEIPICSKSWGEGKLLNEDFCIFKSDTSGNPTEIVIETSPWSPLEKNIYLNIEIDHIESLDGIKFTFDSDSGEVFNYQIPLFADVQFNLVQNSLPTQLSFPLSQSNVIGDLKSNITKLKIFFDAKTGSQVQMKITSIRTAKKISPIGRISLSFDDGYSSHHQAAQIMKKFGFAGTEYLIPSALGKPQYLTLKQAREMKKFGWDIASHHQTPITDFAIKELGPVFKKIKSTIISGLPKNNESGHFAYPLGRYDLERLEVIKKHFKSARLASGGAETLPLANKHRIRVVNVLNSTTPEVLMKQIIKAHKYGDWVVLMFHYFDTPEKGELNFTFANFEKLMAQLKDNKIQVSTVSEVVRINDSQKK